MGGEVRRFFFFFQRRVHLSLVGRDLDTTDGTESLLEITVDGELTGSEGTDHEETGTETGEGSLQSELLGDLDETGSGSLSWSTPVVK